MQAVLMAFQFLVLDVLVSCKRVAKRICDLSPDEVSGMFQLAQKVQIVMESIHNTTSSTITVQDGKDAGQTIEVCWIHDSFYFCQCHLI